MAVAVHATWKGPAICDSDFAHHIYNWAEGLSIFVLQLKHQKGEDVVLIRTR